MRFENRFKQISNELDGDVEEIKGELEMTFENNDNYLDEWSIYLGKIVRLESGLVFPSFLCDKDDNDEVVEDVFKFGILANIHKDENYDKVVNKIRESGIPAIIIQWETGEELRKVNVE